MNAIADTLKELVRIQADICQYSNESTTAKTKRVVLAFAIMTKIVIPLRLGLRIMTQGTLGWDDWIILAAFVCAPCGIHIDGNHVDIFVDI